MHNSDGGNPQRVWDYAPYVIIGLLTIFWILSYQRIAEFDINAAAYIGLAESLKTNGHYDFNFQAHTIYPPGFPFLLMALSLVTGRDPIAAYPVFALFLAFCGGAVLLAGYLLVRRQTDRRWGLVYLGLFGTSPFLFEMSTRTIQADLPYSLCSLSALLVFDRTQGSGKQRKWWGPLLAALVVGSLLTRAIGIALLAGMTLWCCILWLTRRQRAPWAVLVAVAAGLVTQGAWTIWKRAHTVPLAAGEIDQNYEDDFWRKNPHDPDQGKVNIGQLAARTTERLAQEASHVTEFFFLNKWINPLLYSPLVLLPLLLIIPGWVKAVAVKPPGLNELYFICYVAILVLWPFDVGPRYIMPVLPLAFCYLRIGWQQWAEWVREHYERALGGMATGAAAIIVLTGMGLAVTHTRLSMQGKAALAFWGLSFAVLLGLRFMRLGGGGVWAARGSYAYVAAVCAVGLVFQVQMARANQTVKDSDFVLYPTAEAAEWLRDNTPPATVVMAGSPWVVHAISQRRVITFSPTRKPATIVHVMRKNQVKFLVVVDGATWFEPPEVERLDSLQAAYPSALELVHSGGHYRIFRVASFPLDATR